MRYAKDGIRFQLSGDGWAAYPASIGLYLRGRADYAQLIKIYSTPPEGEQRYSPGDVVEAIPISVSILKLCGARIILENPRRFS